MKSDRPGQRRIFYLIIIMTTVSFLSVLVTILILYNTAFREDQRRRLDDVIREAYSIEAVARFDMEFSENDHSLGAFGATISQLQEAHRKHQGLGETGEFTLAELKEDKIHFLLDHRHEDNFGPRTRHTPVPMSGSYAQPMQRALKGESGSMIGFDYRGEKVAATYTPVEGLGRTVGLVSKIDMWEIRRPFFESGLIATITSIFAIMSGIIIFRRVSDPMIKELEESEASLYHVIKKAPVPMVITDKEGHRSHFNDKFIEVFGWVSEDVPTPDHWWAAAYPDRAYRQKVIEGWTRAIEKAHSTGCEIEPQEWKLTTKNGVVRDVEFKMVSVSNDLDVIAMNDVTSQREAEKTLKGRKERLEKLVDMRTSELKSTNEILYAKIDEGQVLLLELEESREQLRALTSHLQDVREDERKKIARDIHDELGQSLTILAFDLSWIEEMLNKDQKQLIEKTRQAIDSVVSAIEKVQKISSDLRPTVLDDLGIVSAIEWQGREFEKRTGIAFHFDFRDDKVKMEEKMATEIFRIFQETMTNVARHSGATTVSAMLKTADNNLILEVMDNGKGIKDKNVLSYGSLGLTGMRERAYSCGGGIDIKGFDGKGTKITLFIPIINPALK